MQVCDRSELMVASRPPRPHQCLALEKKCNLERSQIVQILCSPGVRSTSTCSSPHILVCPDGFYYCAPVTREWRIIDLYVLMLPFWWFLIRLFVCLLCLHSSLFSSAQTFVRHFPGTHNLYRRQLINIFEIVLSQYCINCFMNVLYTGEIKCLLSLLFFLFADCFVFFLLLLRFIEKTRTKTYKCRRG